MSRLSPLGQSTVLEVTKISRCEPSIQALSRRPRRLSFGSSSQSVQYIHLWAVTGQHHVGHPCYQQLPSVTPIHWWYPEHLLRIFVSCPSLNHTRNSFPSQFKQHLLSGTVLASRGAVEINSARTPLTSHQKQVSQEGHIRE